MVRMHQNFLRRLQKQFNEIEGTLKLNNSDVEKLKRYSYEYGEGGFQDRFKAILLAYKSAF